MRGTTILVMGATGTVGGAVAAELAGGEARVRGATRDPARARGTAVPVGEWVPFDLERPETFGSALAGVDRVFLVARPGDEDPLRVAAPLLSEMERRGIRRVVNLTALGVERREDVALREVELEVERGGFEWTHLRPNWFMQVFIAGPLLAGLRRGVLAVPAADARISYVDARDVAAVAAAALTEEGHEGAAYSLTGGESLDHTEVAARLSAAGREIEYRALSEAEARSAVLAAGLDGRRAERLMGFYRLVREGHSAPVLPDVEEVLGRPPIPFDRFVRDHAECWSRGAVQPSSRASS